MQKALTLVAAFALTAIHSQPVAAFHDGGVAYCGGCHTMHNSQAGLPVDPGSPTGNPYLLIRETPSDTCLTCHAAYGQMSTDGQTLGPGGDFYWMTQDISWDSGEGAMVTVFGREHGHNIKAPGYGIQTDSVLTTSPGGSFNSAHLGCNSCHDPHGNGNFRLLYGIGTTQANYPGNYTFNRAAPMALGCPWETGITDAGAEKIGQHTAYISGMSDWCANCHNNMHSGRTNNIVHPTNIRLGSTLRYNYNGYRTTSDKTHGQYSSAYLPLVPFEDPLNTTTSTTGAGYSSKVMCLTCHRAHASPYRDAGRWDFEQTRLSDSHPANEPYLSQYVGNPLDMAAQRSLCNKCHIQD
ncbi:MAG: hypothetical protein HY801_05870 [Candidatus Lindowbacteria bacterium]|nr:hypothetical protein [Candidatus Lindowbacteria bacterium]